MISEDRSIVGVRLEVYGRNQDVAGLDLGVANETKGGFAGFGVGLVNLVDRDMTGVQWNVWGYGKVGGRAAGWVSGLVTQVQGDTVGLQDGVVAITHGEFTGAQIGAIYNQVDESVAGLQLSIVNRAHHVSGVQIGLVNWAHSMKGLQFGLLNKIESKSKMKLFPIVNWQF